MGVPFGITLSKDEVNQTNLVLDNLVVDNSAIIVSYSGGDTIFTGSAGRVYFTSWAMGRRYTTLDGNGTVATGLLNPAPTKSPGLLDPMGRFFCRSRPQYEAMGSGKFIIATANNIKNDGTGDQGPAINALLEKSAGKPVFFPAGIYQVQTTVFVPVNSVILGEGWSQVSIIPFLSCFEPRHNDGLLFTPKIRTFGAYFQDANNTQVMVKYVKSFSFDPSQAESSV